MPVANHDFVLQTEVAVHILGCEELGDATSYDEDIQAFGEEITELPEDA
jgi:hypothetical protein